MRVIFFICFTIISELSFSQYKSFDLSTKGDTLNRVDQNNLKQGLWITQVESLRGEPGYLEKGRYIEGKKEGLWKKYNLTGDILAEENYKWGYKNGKCSYYNLYGIEREESWKAIDPRNPYDTIDVPDLNSDVVYKRIMKVDASTVKHGTWNYYNPQTGALIKTEEYVVDQLIPKKNATAGKQNISDSAGAKKTDSVASTTKIKPKEVLEYEKKNANKKKIKVRDGATGVQ